MDELDRIAENALLQACQMATERYVTALETENTELRELLADCVLSPEVYGKKYNLEPNYVICGKHWENRVRALGIKI